MSPDFINVAVGPMQANAATDVSVVQTMLNKHVHFTGITVAVTGKFDHDKERAIFTYQRKVLVMHHPDGIVSPSGPTFRKLKESSVRARVKPKAANATASNLDGYLSDAQYQAAATSLSSPGAPCEVAVIKAVAKIESPRGPFDAQGRPNILFERHIFSDRTDGEWDESHPHISNPVPEGKGEYGLFSAQYGRLAEAEALDRENALESASWGAFQIMGFNYANAGATSIDDFVSKMQSGVPAQLNAFVSLIKNNSLLLKAVQKKDWYAFALNYNGNIGTKKNPKIREKYDKRLEQAYNEIVRASTPAKLPGTPAAPAATPVIPLP